MGAAAVLARFERLPWRVHVGAEVRGFAVRASSLVAAAIRRRSDRARRSGPEHPWGECRSSSGAALTGGAYSDAIRGSGHGDSPSWVARTTR